MLKQLFFVSAVLLPIGAQATPLSEADRTVFIGFALKSCTEGVNSNEAVKRIWSQTELYNYCSCKSVTMANNTTMEDLNYIAANEFRLTPELEERIINPADEYCGVKYLPAMPDVSDIKDKKW